MDDQGNRGVVIGDGRNLPGDSVGLRWRGILQAKFRTGYHHDPFCTSIGLSDHTGIVYSGIGRREGGGGEGLNVRVRPVSKTTQYMGCFCLCIVRTTPPQSSPS